MLINTREYFKIFFRENSSKILSNLLSRGFKLDHPLWENLGNTFHCHLPIQLAIHFQARDPANPVWHKIVQDLTDESLRREKEALEKLSLPGTTVCVQLFIFCGLSVLSIFLTLCRSVFLTVLYGWFYHTVLSCLFKCQVCLYDYVPVCLSIFWLSCLDYFFSLHMSLLSWYVFLSGFLSFYFGANQYDIYI
jgi:hypothetical protein